MRFFFLALAATAFLLPAAAVSDPVQGSAGTNAQAAPASASSAPAPAAAQAPAAPSQSATTAAQTGPESVVVRADPVDLNQVVCKEAPASTGSRIGGGQECHTQREWNRRMRESQDITRRQQVLGFHQ